VNEVFSTTYTGDKNAIKNCIAQFDSSGKNFDVRNRNSLKLFEVDGKTINIKSFKKPNYINRVVYRFFRPSKAERSFTYAHKLLEKGISTPQPIAYFEKHTFLGFGNSFYVSEHLNYDLTYRELIGDSQFEGNESILKAFAAFTYSLHSKGIHFLDHSAGNTLIKIKENGTYDFYLVDLNRMEFGKLDYKTRIKNFERLSKIEAHIKVTAGAYATLSGDSPEEVYEDMKRYALDYQMRFRRKKRWKKRFKFWGK